MHFSQHFLEFTLPSSTSRLQTEDLVCTSVILRVITFWLAPPSSKITYKGNIEACFCNHCCSGKVMCYIFLVCVCSLWYPACNAHAPCCEFTRGLSGCTNIIFLNFFFINGKDFEKNSYWTQNVFFFLISLQIYVKHFSFWKELSEMW